MYIYVRIYIYIYIKVVRPLVQHDLLAAQQRLAPDLRDHYIYIYIHISLSLYIYIERESDVYIYIYTHISIDVYMYMQMLHPWDLSGTDVRGAQATEGELRREKRARAV